MCMVAGLLIPLAFFTMISIHRFYTYTQYQRYLQDSTAFSQTELDSIEQYQKSLKTENETTVDPFAETNKSEQIVLDTVTNRVIGYLSIPKLEIRQPIFLGATEQHLSDGVAVLHGTSLPIGGIGTRSVIAGHRGWYTDVRFLRLNMLQEGDEIFVEINGKTLTYIVHHKEVIKATEWQRLKPEEDQDMLTLLTCDPLVPPFDYRLLVNAYRQPELVTEDLSEKQVAAKEQMEAFQQQPFDTVFYMTVVGWIVLVWIVYRWVIYYRQQTLEKEHKKS